jgi:hypothetical protein
MKNIELLELEGKIQNPIMEFLLEHDNYLEKEQIDAILSRGESGLEDLRLILKAYNQHHLKFKDDEGIWFMSSVLLALAYLRDEASFDDMIAYLYTNFDAINTTWGDGYYEAFPMCYAVFPNKIPKIKEILYDPELTIDMKRILMMGLYSMPKILNRPELDSTIAPVFLDYLTFLLVPENRKTQKEVHEDWLGIEDLLNTTIKGYMNCGGESTRIDSLQLIDEELENPTISEIFNFDKWKKKIFDLWDIYTHNAGLEKFQKTQNEYHELKAREALLEAEIKEKKEERNRILNVTKQFRKIYDRNDKVNVKYKADGKIVNDVKYKKVEDDLISGKCEII